MNFDIQKIRKDFPILNTSVYGKPLVYFDNAATTQKPKAVIDALTKYYFEYNSNIHRGVHFLSQKATEAYEISRRKIRDFINAADTSEIIFTRGTTEAINLIACSFGRKFLKKDDIVLVSAMEHHSNIVPWQMICEEKHAFLKIIPILEDGSLDMDAYEKLLDENVKIVSVMHISNVLGTVNPIKEIIAKAHVKNIPVMIDGAQATAHLKVDVKELDCDFYCFSGHKMYGPTGIGVLYGKLKWLHELPPYQGGGDMIEEVTFEKTTYNVPPLKFEAGTQNIADAIALQHAVEYIENIGIDNICRQEDDLRKYSEQLILNTGYCRIFGNSHDKSAVVSFEINGIHPYDAGTIIDKYGIAVRTGHHCAQPLMKILGIPGTIRASFAFYNTQTEIDKLMEAISKVKQMFS